MLTFETRDPIASSPSNRSLNRLTPNEGSSWNAVCSQKHTGWFTARFVAPYSPVKTSSAKFKSALLPQQTGVSKILLCAQRGRSLARFRGSPVNGDPTWDNLPDGLQVVKESSGMVLAERETLNTLFETLQEWEGHLASIDHDDLRCDDDQTFAP